MAFVNKKSRTNSSNNNPHNISNNISNTQNSNKLKLDSLTVIKNMKTENDAEKERLDYLEKSKKIIDKLESQFGFDFYDENRYGGMHINGDINGIKNSNKSEKNNFEEKVNTKQISSLLSKIKKN